MPDNHPDRAYRLQSLGVRYHNRYLRAGAIEDLDIAIQRFQEAVDITPDNHSNRVDQLQSLRARYHERYLQTGAIADLEVAIQRYQEALDITPDDHPDQARLLQYLGVGYYSRYESTGAIEDLEIVIQRLEEALDITPDDHPDRAQQLYSLGTGYQDRYRRKKAIADLEVAIQQFQEAVSQSSSPTLDRFQPGKTLLLLHATAKHWSLAYQAASTVISLIPLLTPRSLSNSDKQYWLTEVVGLASDAAAVALMAEKPPYEVIRLLELGRGVITGSLGDIRVDTSELQQKHPQLAEEYIKLRDQIDAPVALMRQVDQLNTPIMQGGRVSQRFDAGRKLEGTIQAIRSLPGFDRFLMAPSEDELRTAAASGPIAIINVSEYRCDAIIIEKRRLRTVQLPHLHSGDIRARAAALAQLDSLDM